jgi:threonine dehydrogenase-like Zn-dependent dehydrogenase
MRAAIFAGPGRPIRIEQVEDPRPSANELLLKISRCGICGSDLSMTADSPITFRPGRFGHEYAGEILEVGRNVSGFRVGDRLAVMPAMPCGACDGCREGNATFCLAARTFGGGFAEYAVISPDAAVPLPQTLSLSDGALIEPMACGLHALRLARLRGAERIVVLGAGSMALSVVFWARHLGAGSIVVLSRSSHRADVALSLGADAVLELDADPKELTSALGGPPDVVAECVGKPGLLEKAIALVRPQGTVLGMGMCTHSEPLMTMRCVLKELRLLFPLAYSVDEFIETARVFETSGIHPDVMVSDVIGLEQLPDMMEALRAGKKSLKVHVDANLRKPPS